MNPETPSERVALVVWWLVHGEGLTTKQVASLAQISTRGAFDLMDRISRVLPIYQDEDYVWQVCESRNGAA